MGCSVGMFSLAADAACPLPLCHAGGSAEARRPCSFRGRSRHIPALSNQLCATQPSACPKLPPSDSPPDTALLSRMVGADQHGNHTVYCTLHERTYR